jgi:hypothetical protein
MSCKDIPSLLDLQKVKKHADDFGRLMGTGTGTSTNEVTGQVRPTYNKVIGGMNNEFNTMIGGMNNEFDTQILNMGFACVGTFAAGATLTNPRQTLLWDISDGGDGQEYGWSGTFPPSGKVVSPGSTPLTTGGIAVGAWISRFDPELRIQVREALRRSYAEAGYVLVAGSFEAGGALVNANDVLLQESTGKAFSGPAGAVAAGTNPASGGFTDRSQITSTNATLGEIATGKFGVGSVITIKDRAWAVCDVVSGGTANGIDILDAGLGKTAVIRTSKTLILDKFVNDITGTTVVTAAVLRCVALLKGMGGGELIAPATYLIDGQIDTTTRVTVDGLGAGRIIQRANDVGILCPIDGAMVRNWTYRGITLEYETQQTSVAGTAIKLSKNGTVSYLYNVTNVIAKKCYHGVSCPNLPGSNTFLGTFQNVVIEDPTSWGFIIEGDAVGANTNIRLDQTWVVNNIGNPQPAAGGYLLRRITDLDCGRMACDRINGTALFVETSTGNIGSLSIEACNYTATSGIKAAVNISAGAVSINNLFFVGNVIDISGSASFAYIMFGSGAKVDIQKITDSSSSVTDNSTGSVYSLLALSNGRFNNGCYVGPARSRQDTANRSIFTWDGASLRDARGTATVAAGGFINTGLAGQVKQYTVHITPTTPESVPTVRPVVVEVTSTGGMKVRYYNISDGAQNFGSYSVSWTASIE